MLPMRPRTVNLLFFYTRNAYDYTALVCGTYEEDKKKVAEPEFLKLFMNTSSFYVFLEKLLN